MKNVMRDLFVALLVGFALFLSGCASESETPKPEAPKVKEKILRISTTTDPTSLDPRLVRDLPTVTPLHMLYEGLKRATFGGKIEPALAEETTISPDLKTYTFKLRESKWSDGTSLTAHDFVYTWKSLLDPKFPAPNAYQLYVIKGAKAANEGNGSLDDVAIKALDAQTLQVELESPTPYFEELLATHFYLPVKQDGTEPNNLISNGPFMLDHWDRNDELVAVKNPQYWDVDTVNLDKVVLIPLDDHTALQMFETEELGWTGSPMSTLPADTLDALQSSGRLAVAPAAGTYFFRFNTAMTPLHNKKLRRAFALAINRKDLTQHVIQGNHQPALGLIPPSLGFFVTGYFQDDDTTRAWYLFQEGLEEIGISKDELPPIVLCYTNGDRNHKIAQAVQQQWNKTFGISVKLNACESQLFFDKRKSGAYQIALGSWFADIRDPINFLDVFKSRKTSTNNTGWENVQYKTLLELSSLEMDQEKRKSILRNAEGVLMDQMPIAPLFYSSLNYLKQNDIINVYLSELGYLDFKYADIGEIVEES